MPNSASKIISTLEEAEPAVGVARLKKALDDAKIAAEVDGLMMSIYLDDFNIHAWPRTDSWNFRILITEYNHETGEDDDIYDQTIYIDDAVRLIKKYHKISRRRAIDALGNLRSELLGEGEKWYSEVPELVALEAELDKVGIRHERRRNGLFVFVCDAAYRVSVGWKRSLIINLDHDWPHTRPQFADTPRLAADIFAKMQDSHLSGLKSELLGEAQDRDWSWVVPIATAGFTVISNCAAEATLALDPERTFGGIFVVEKFWDGFRLDYAGMDPIFYDFKSVHCDSMGELIDKIRETQQELIRRRNLEKIDSLETLKGELEA
jgi:hypothetical protein